MGHEDPISTKTSLYHAHVSHKLNLLAMAASGLSAPTQVRTCARNREDENGVDLNTVVPGLV